MILGPSSKTSPLLQAFVWTIWSRKWGCRQLHDLLSSTFLDFLVGSWSTNWYSLEMQNRVPPWLSLSNNGVVKSCSSCLSMIRQPSWWSRKELHWWKLHLTWLRDVILQPWLFMVSQDIVSSPPMIDVCWHKDGCHDVVASSHPYSYCRCASWCLRRWRSSIG
jgi:hypothetical protein